MKLITALKWMRVNWLESIAAAALAGACTVTFINVIVRYFFTKFVLVGAEELTTLFISWAVFVGAACAYKHKMLFGIDILINLLPIIARNVIEKILKVLVIIVSVIATYMGWVFANSAWIRTTSNLNIPYFFMDIPICICFAMIAFYSIQELVNDIHGLFGGNRTAQPGVDGIMTEEED